MLDIVLLTDSRYENPSNPDTYVQNILKDDFHLQNALEAKGLKVQRVDWARKDFDWSTTRYAMFRSTWDYFHRYAEFTSWLESTAKVTEFINSLDIIRWNMDKRYMLDLQQKNINIPPTHFIEQGDTATLASLHEQLGWDKTILKPTFSGAARHTYLLSKATLASHEAIFETLIAEEAMMLQTFQHHIVSEGEKSLMMMDGEYTHAVLKVAKKGDFRVQDDFGGTVHDYTPTAEEITFAKQAVAACPSMPFYARVDIFNDNNGDIALGELELIEPELWFRAKPKAAEVLAEAIVKRLGL